jgi:hypothetical protein
LLRQVLRAESWKEMTVSIRTLADWRSSLLVCDACDGVMARDGSLAAKRHRESDPDDLAPHYMCRADVEAAAVSSGWVLEGDARWACPPCLSRTARSGSR